MSSKSFQSAPVSGSIYDTFARSRYQCFTHVAGNYPSFNQFQIDGVSMQQAVSLWWDALDATAEREPKVYLDGIWGLDGISTNPSCTY